MIIRFLISAASLALITASSAYASPLVFQGQNAALFPGANPSDTALLMNSVPKPASDPTSQANLTSANLIQSAIESQISSKIYNDIFGSGAASSGSEVLGNGNIIKWQPDPSGTGVQVTIYYANGGSSIIYGSAP
ncbi:MAG TPA: hypothetical protein VFT64_11600 [Rickettsiales bacterium]|nr:hypothetical protein [Rickettsiales bacterium]